MPKLPKKGSTCSQKAIVPELRLIVGEIVDLILHILSLLLLFVAFLVGGLLDSFSALGQDSHEDEKDQYHCDYASGCHRIRQIKSLNIN